jgi:hypothetical protein
VVARVVQKWNGWGGDAVLARLKRAAKENVTVDALGPKFAAAEGKKGVVLL